MAQFLLSLCGQIRIGMHYSLLVRLLADEVIDDLFRMRKRIGGRLGPRPRLRARKAWTRVNESTGPGRA